MHRFLFRRFCTAVALVAAVLNCHAAAAADNAVVLMYHRFAEDRYPSTNIRLDQFRAHLDYLQSQSFNVVSLADLLAALDGKVELPEKAVVITIDDAYRSVYEVAWPLFREYGYPFTVFVSSDPVDGGSPAYMSWAQMREMLNSGASYANHGAAHGDELAVDVGFERAQRHGRLHVEEARKERLRGVGRPFAARFVVLLLRSARASSG